MVRALFFVVIFSISALIPLGAKAADMPKHTFEIKDGAFQLDGKPFQIICGEMEYCRIPPEYWRDRFRKAHAMGINTIATYVCWNLHEPRPGEFCFTGNADIAAFIRAAQEEGLWVILRTGPYICGEWEFGGYPAWLLKSPEIHVRSTDPRFLDASAKYLDRLGQELAPLQITHGGPIIIAQVENEYGSFGHDHAYMLAIRDQIVHAGFDVPLDREDGTMPRMADGGHVQGVLPVSSGGGIADTTEMVNKYFGDGPYMVGEFYPGWLDHWGQAHETRKAAPIAKELDGFLAAHFSVNIYEIHGGTNWGFMNGSNGADPQPTSYDYDAPINEAGQATPKYFALRKVILSHLPPGTHVPDVPADNPVMDIPRFTLTESAPIDQLLHKPVAADHPIAMEDLDQAYGFVLYRTTLAGTGAGPLKIQGLRDYAQVLLDGKPAGIIQRRLKQNSLVLSVDRAPATLDLLVENLGRINYGGEMVNNRMGILGDVTFNGKKLTDWQSFSMPCDDLSGVTFTPGDLTGPALHAGTFQVAQPADTFLDMRGWGKGVVWINGHNLGRFWHIGPQQTLYVPGPWLKAGDNRIIVLETSDRGLRSVAGLARPILDHLEK